MTAYDHCLTVDGTLHPLSGIPQEVLDAATNELAKALEYELGIILFDRYFERSVVDSVAHSILASAINAAEQLRKEEGL